MNSFHGEVSALYLNQAATIFLPLKQLSYQRMKLSPEHHVLDVGCGPGVDVMALAERVSPAGKVTGFDHDMNMLNQALLKIEDASLKQVVSLIQGNAANLPFQDNCFDSCRSERLFMHLQKPEQTLAEMVRVTKPGGSIVILDTDWSSLSIDNPLPAIEQTLSDYRIAHVLNNGYSGRSLYRQFRQQRLANIEVELLPICITDKDLFYFISMQEIIEDQALQQHVITPQELKYWRSELDQAASEQSFYGSANVVMVSAIKPEA